MNLHSIIISDILFWVSHQYLHEGCRYTGEDPGDIDPSGHHGCSSPADRDYVMYCECRECAIPVRHPAHGWYHYFVHRNQRDGSDASFICAACNAGQCPRPPL